MIPSDLHLFLNDHFHQIDPRPNYTGHLSPKIIKVWIINNKKIYLFFNNEKKFEAYVIDKSNIATIYETRNGLNTIIGIPKVLITKPISEIKAFFKDTYAYTRPLAQDQRLYIHPCLLGGMKKDDSNKDPEATIKVKSPTHIISRYSLRQSRSSIFFLRHSLPEKNIFENYHDFTCVKEKCAELDKCPSKEKRKKAYLPTDETETIARNLKHIDAKLTNTLELHTKKSDDRLNKVTKITDLSNLFKITDELSEDEHIFDEIEETLRKNQSRLQESFKCLLNEETRFFSLFITLKECFDNEILTKVFYYFRLDYLFPLFQPIVPYFETLRVSKTFWNRLSWHLAKTEQLWSVKNKMNASSKIISANNILFLKSIEIRSKKIKETELLSQHSQIKKERPIQMELGKTLKEIQENLDKIRKENEKSVAKLQSKKEEIARNTQTALSTLKTETQKSVSADLKKLEEEQNKELDSLYQSSKTKIATDVNTAKNDFELILHETRKWV